MKGCPLFSLSCVSVCLFSYYLNLFFHVRRNAQAYGSGFHRVNRSSHSYSNGNADEKTRLLGDDSVEFKKGKEDNLKLKKASLSRVLLNVFGFDLFISQVTQVAGPIERKLSALGRLFLFTEMIT